MFECFMLSLVGHVGVGGACTHCQWESDSRWGQCGSVWYETPVHRGISFHRFSSRHVSKAGLVNLRTRTYAPVELSADPTAQSVRRERGEQ